MRRRRKLSRRSSKKLFRRTSRPHRKNMMGGVMAGPMRGGIRL